MRSSLPNDSIRYPDVSTNNKELSEIRLQIDELNQQMAEWRRRLAWQEEMSFFALKAEELGRRLSALEKRVAHETEGQAVEIRFRADPLVYRVAIAEDF